MSETLNVNVLVAAKEEYTKQLVYILSPEIYIIILNVFNESQLLKKKRSISLRNFQLQLKKIPVWNTIIIEKNTSDIKSKIPYLLDLITAIFVSHVKILACVRLKQDSKSIQVKVPNLDTFLHKIIITNAEKIYYNPDLILKKKEIVISLISDTIEETIRNQIPIDKILTEYLSGVFDQDNTNLKEDLEKNSMLNEVEDEEIEDEQSDKEKKEDEDEDEYENEDEDENEDENEVESNKNIYPSRPLPQGQIDNEIINENSNKFEHNIPIKNIKNRVLFSDAIEKTIKSSKHNNDNDNDSESDDYSDVDDKEDECTK